ncbi:hypothetical protein UG55_10685 [Frankia sp. EI5c]|nr:hypothetical protein UG55_10985 [Frankia sp. EI5c]OAA20851.1 hypothetical protein UG55_10685 [Frankia sp. EI5c]
MHAAGKVHGLVGSEIWTGRAARYVNNAVSDWQAVARPAAEAVRGLATLLRGAADDLTREQADWQRRVDRYDAAVRDLSRWGRT